MNASSKIAIFVGLSLVAGLAFAGSVTADTTGQLEDDSGQQDPCYSISTPTGGYHAGCLAPGNCGGGGYEGGIYYVYQC